MPELNKYLKHHGLLKQRQKRNKNDKVKAIMGHSLQMNTLRTGKTEVGGSNESGPQTAGKLMVPNTRVMPLTLKTAQMMSFLLLSPQTRNMQTRERLATTRSGRAVTKRAEKLTFDSFE